MKKSEQRIHRINMKEFFRARVHDSLDHAGLDTSDMVEFYLVNLLDEYREAAKLFSVEGDGPIMKPLAILLKDAMEGDDVTRRKYLKKLGDTALYISGFFADYIHRSLVNMEYYISMGGSAYGSLSTLAKKQTLQELYYELALHFGNLVNVLAEISPWSQHLDNKRLVQIYALWLESGDERLEEILKREGIDTTESPKR
jgi:hypothetical protein